MSENDLFPVTIIPKYNQFEKVISLVEDRLLQGSIVGKGKVWRNGTPRLEVVVKRSSIERIGKVSKYVDFVAVDGLDAHFLSNDFESYLNTGHIAEDNGIYVNGDHKASFFSSFAKPHPRRIMSGDDKKNWHKHSDATYSWVIERTDEPFDGEYPIAFLLQFIKPNGGTSSHYHKKTTEFMIPLVGSIKYVAQKIEECSPIASKTIKPGKFVQMIPGTAHMFIARNEPAINLLCMKPYDPELKDHFYKVISSSE